MPTVYAININNRFKVRYRGVVHYAGSERLADPEYSMGAMAPRGEPNGARCGVIFEGEDTPAYLVGQDDVFVTCVACLGDRRGRG